MPSKAAARTKRKINQNDNDNAQKDQVTSSNDQNIPSIESTEQSLSPALRKSSRNKVKKAAPVDEEEEDGVNMSSVDTQTDFDKDGESVLPKTSSNKRKLENKETNGQVEEESDGSEIKAKKTRAQNPSTSNGRKTRAKKSSDTAEAVAAKSSNGTNEDSAEAAAASKEDEEVAASASTAMASNSSESPVIVKTEHWCVLN